MKKIIALVLMLAASNAFAEESPWKNKPNSVKPIVYTECKAGKLVIIAASQYGVALMQLFEDRDEMVPKPMECGEEDE